MIKMFMESAQQIMTVLRLIVHGGGMGHGQDVIMAVANV